MLRFYKFFIVLLFATIALLPRPSSAALIYTYDLDSLCYMSTDIVEASLVRHHVAGQPEWEDTVVATVIAPIAGKYKTGDRINSLDLDLYDPCVSGQHCILFIARKQFYLALQPSETIAPRVTDMLLIDKDDHVRRYFQFDNPGGLVAEGYSFSWIAQRTDKNGIASSYKAAPFVEDDTAEQKYPTLDDERETITAKRIETSRLSPLLSRNPRPEDIPALLNLLRHRPLFPADHLPFNSLADNLAVVICSRLADLNDPHVALEALSIPQGRIAGWRSGLETEPFRTSANLAYARTVAQDKNETEARRAAAAEVLKMNAN